MHLDGKDLDLEGCQGGVMGVQAHAHMHTSTHKTRTNTQACTHVHMHTHLDGRDVALDGRVGRILVVHRRAAGAVGAARAHSAQVRGGEGAAREAQHLGAAAAA